MRLIPSLVIVIFLGACASKPHQKLLVDTDSSLFAQESLLRTNVVQGEESHLLKGCYEGDLNTFTQKARQVYNKGAKTAQYWIWVSNCLVWNSELREARFFLTLADGLAKTDTEKATIKNNMGIIYLRIGKVSQAYLSFQEAQKLAPHLVSPSFNLAQIYVQQNLNQEALKILNQPPFHKSQDPEVLHLTGLAHLQLKNLKLAGTYLEKISSKFYSREDFALTLAQWHLWSGRPQKSVEMIEGLKSTGLPVPAQLMTRIKREAQQQIAVMEKK
jgi:tetratricopeptide (TPR) repeat protein